MKEFVSEARTRMAFRLALLVCLLAISYLAFASLEDPLGTSNDKLNHILAFFVLAWLADRSYPGRRLAPYRWALLLAYGIMIEAIQGFIPYRELSFLDVAADAAGILIYGEGIRIIGKYRRANPVEQER